MICLFNKTGECVKKLCYAYIPAKTAQRVRIDEGELAGQILPTGSDTKESCVFCQVPIKPSFLSGLLNQPFKIEEDKL
jgi:hypothetical protein